MTRDQRIDSHPAKSIVGYLRANLGRRRNAIRVGPFLAAFDPDSDNPYRNYAIPEGWSRPHSL